MRSDNSLHATYGKPFGVLFSISRYRELFPDIGNYIGNSDSRYRKIISDIGKWWIKTQMAFHSHEHAVSAPWLRSQSPVRTPWERGGTPWALLGNATVAVGAPWHLHVMGNVKLFAIFFSIFVRSHGALRNFKSPCQRRGIAVECDRGFLTHMHGISTVAIS